MSKEGSNPLTTKTRKGLYLLVYLLSIYCLLFLVTTSPLYASDGWAATYGGDNHDRARSIQQTRDGGYIVAGYGGSFDGLWVLKLRGEGTIEWQKTYGGVGAESVQQTRDGGYIVAGREDTRPFGGGRPMHRLLVLKIGKDGTVEWQKTLGVGCEGGANSIKQTIAGRYIVAGWTGSVSEQKVDFWILKLRGDGTVEWQKTYGGAEWDEAQSIEQTDDGGYVVAGNTRSFGVGDFDVWVLKLGPDGAIEWQRTYGGINADGANFIQQTNDGGYVMAGGTSSFGAGKADIWILKLGPDGTVEWQKTYGGVASEWAEAIQQISDGGYIVAGWTESFGAGKLDLWVLRLRQDGTVEWQKTYGGMEGDEAQSIQQNDNGGYIVAGCTESLGSDKKVYDYWVLKLNPDGSIHPSCGFIRDTSVSGQDSSATFQTTSVSPVDSSAKVLDSSLRGWITEVPASILCP